MTVYALGDLHLLGGDDKPMDVFGAHWTGHAEKIRENWLARVQPEDTVLIPGDVSWAMYLEAVREDLAYIGSLPGRKILLRGNHDYWWNAIGQVRRVLPEGMFALQNDAFLLEDVLIAGARGWLLPGSGEFSSEDEKIFRRELVRLEMSLEAARRLSDSAPLIVMTHFPPTFQDGRETECTRLIAQYRADICVYGHLHGGGIHNAFRGMLGNTRYLLASCDALGFDPLPIWPSDTVLPS